MDAHLPPLEINFRAIVEGSPDAISRLDSNLCFLYQNPAAARFWWDQPVDCVGKSLAETVVPAETAAAWRQALERVLQTGQPYRMDFNLSVPDGERSFTAHFQPELSPNGQVQSVLAQCCELGGTPRVEQDLGLQGAAQILASIQDGFFALNVNWNFTFVNERAALNSGATPGALIGKNLWEIYPQLLGTPAEHYYRKVMLERVPVQFQMDGLKSDRWYDVSVYPAGSGIAIYWQDETTRKAEEAERARLAQALRQSEERLRLADKAVPGVVYDINIGRDQMYQSEGLERVVGYRPGEEPGGSQDWWPRHIHPQDIQRIQADLRAAIEGQADAVSYEYRIQHADGHWVNILDQAHIVRDEEGRAVRVVGTAIDISERKRSEEALKAYVIQLEQTRRELQDFAFIASHDLQEPLRKVRAFSDLLRERHGGLLTPEALEYIERITGAVRGMEKMLEGLLLYSRVTSQPHPFQTVDLNEVINEVLNDLEQRIENSRAQITVQALPLVQADPLQMRQLFQNLIANALKFHRPGESPQVRIWGEQCLQDNQVQLMVEDQGIGFDEQYLARIFQPFQRLHGKSDYEGYGIGLAICQKIVNRHGGQITARSASGQGTTFIVTLPAARADEEDEL